MIGFLVVIEIGLMMLDFNFGCLVFIVVVIIDLRIGNVIFLGGILGELDRGDEILLLFSDLFIEFLLGRLLKVIGVRFVDDGEEKELELMGGGY